MRPDRDPPRWVSPHTPLQPTLPPTLPRGRARRRLRLREDPSGSRLFWLITGTVALAVAGFWTILSVLAAEPPRAAGQAASSRPPAQQAAAAAPGAEDGFSRGARRRRQEMFALLDGQEAPFERLGEPQPGDWLFSFKERGQTVAEHRQRAQNRRSAGRQTLHLLPFADLSPDQQLLLPTLREFVATYFATRTVILPTRPLDRRWQNPARQQIDALPVLDELAGRVPPDSLGLVGLMRTDLFLNELNFVFGAALLHERASIQSLSRFFIGKDRQGLDRLFKLLAHEIGHMFGLEHCVFYRCLMNGTNSLAETERAPLHLCPICLAKLLHSLELDPVQRYRQLAAFYRKAGLADEAAFVSQLIRGQL